MQNELVNITRIVDQSDRKLLYYGDDDEYYVIADMTEDVKVGDMIEYKPYGVNFGWFVAKRAIA